jgi:hypothetical protein
VARLSKIAPGSNQFVTQGKEVTFDKGKLSTLNKLAEESGIGRSAIEFAKSVIKNGTSNVVAR